MKGLLSLSVLLLCHAVAAQEPEAPPAGKDRTGGQAAQRAQAMRKQIGEGRQVQSHVKVLVRLKNGNRLVGVVKDGKLVERIDGLRFVEANAQEDGAGIRVWYTSGVRNFVFVPFRELAEYEIIQQLTNEQVLQIENEMQRNQGKTPAPGDAAAKPGDEAKPAEPATAAAGGEPAKAGAVQAVDKEHQKAWFDLVQAYPPAAGWGPARRDEIKRRFVVLGTKPSAVEQRFADQYDEWAKACAYFGVEPAKADGKSAAATTDQRAEEKSDRRARRGETTPAPSGGAVGDEQRKEERRARRGRSSGNAGESGGATGESSGGANGGG